jgi:hypothetical protein
LLDGHLPREDLFARAADATLADGDRLAKYGHKAPHANALIQRALAAVIA